MEGREPNVWFVMLAHADHDGVDGVDREKPPVERRRNAPPGIVEKRARALRDRLPVYLLLAIVYRLPGVRAGRRDERSE